MKLDTKDLVRVEMQKLSGLSVSELIEPKGNEARVARRVLAWAYVQLLGEDLSSVAKDLRIEHSCSLHRIMRRKNLSADEYDLRRRLHSRLQPQLGLR